MIHILYDTNNYYNKNIGENFYCKTVTSAKRKLKAQLKDDIQNKLITIECQKEVLKKFDVWALNKKTMWSVWDLHIDTESDDLQIMVCEIDLF